MMRTCLLLVLLVALPIVQVGGQAVKVGAAQQKNAAANDKVDAAVRSLMETIAHDVTSEGPTAWRKHFEDSPVFFMVNDGQMAFADSAAATKGINDFAATIKSMRLDWGSDLRVDPLTPSLAVVAVSYAEDLNPLSGKPVQARGYFTGVAELKDGRWQLRNAHWSSLRAQ